jgi:hypothetical protein
LQKEQAETQAKLTPAKAMLLYCLYAYERMGEASSLFAANKLAYFLQRIGESLKLKFVAHHYGPYAVQVGHVLYALNGKYLKGLEQKTAKAFEPLMLNYGVYEEVKEYVDTQLTHEQRKRLDSLLFLIDGFQSTLSLEVLASVDFVLKENPSYTKEQVFDALQQWSDRKKDLFKFQYVSIAYDHLHEYSQKLEIK